MITRNYPQRYSETQSHIPQSRNNVHVRFYRILFYKIHKKPIQPKIYAMFTLLFLIIFVLMTAMNLMQLVSDRKKAVSHIGH